MNNIKSLATIARNNGIENTTKRLRDDIVSEYTEIVDSLNTIEKSVINKDISLLPVYKVNESCIKEGYVIDLSSLKYIVESEQCALEEAVQKIKDVNSIYDLAPMYCVLPENINENMSLESFITLYNSLIESGITPISLKKFDESEFINEGAFNNIKNMIDETIAKFNIDRLNKEIKKCEKNNKELQQKLKTFKNADKDKQTKILLANIGKLGLKIAATAGASVAIHTAVPYSFGFVAGKYCLDLKDLAIVTTNIVNGTVIISSGYKILNSPDTAFTPALYIDTLELTISINKSTIAKCKKRLKELESKK